MLGPYYTLSVAKKTEANLRISLLNVFGQHFVKFIRKGVALLWLVVAETKSLISQTNLANNVSRSKKEHYLIYILFNILLKTELSNKFLP